MKFSIDRDLDFTDSDKDVVLIVKKDRLLIRDGYNEHPKLGHCELCGKHTYIHKTKYENEAMWICNNCKIDLFYGGKHEIIRL